MAEILRNPDVGKKARLELDQVVGLKRAIDESHIPQLKYIQAIIKETLRLHATVPLLIPHQSMSATKAFGYDIPAKTRLFVNVWAIG
jgi:cytochrome P450